MKSGARFGARLRALWRGGNVKFGVAVANERRDCRPDAKLGYNSVVSNDPQSGCRQRRRVVVLGSTGSIGVNTLDVAARHPDRFEVAALAARRNVERLAEQCIAYRPRYAVMIEEDAAARLAEALAANAPQVEVLCGVDALQSVAASGEVDAVMAAIVGAAGLPAALAAARAGDRKSTRLNSSHIQKSRMPSSA